MIINGYEVIGELNNANSGFSKWGFARKNGRVYFLKEMINPVYPVDESSMSVSMLAQRRNFCIRYEARCKKLYTAINNASYGNLVRIVEFFRYGSRYYIITDPIENSASTIEAVSGLPPMVKYRILKSVAFCFSCLHESGIAHFDVKPSNIILKRTARGGYAAKLIDFDSSFFKEEIRDEIELGGDLTYLAPETFLHICGENSCVDENADIFALGLVFHEFFCGKLPLFDANEYEYPYEAALDGGTLTPDFSVVPERLAKLIADMLNVEPSKRPSASGIVTEISEIIAESIPESVAVVPTVLPKTSSSVVDFEFGSAEQSQSDGWFRMAGDL